MTGEARVHIPTERKEGRLRVGPALVYIGRRYKRGPYDFAASPCANPYPVEPNGRDRAVALYREHVQNSPGLLSRLEELRGKTLGCWCKPDEACHGDVLIKLLKGRNLVG